MRTMILVWFGKLSLDAAVRSDRMDIAGPRQLRDRLVNWFLLSPITMPAIKKRLAASA